MKRLLTLLLLGSILIRPLWADEAAPLSGKTAQPLSLFKKKSIPVKAHPTPGLFGYREIPSATRPGGGDSAELSRFLQETCGTGKTRELSGTDKLLGTLGTMASGVCAGVAAVQWLDAQNSPGQKTNGSKGPGTNPSAKTI
jgi:hypothetical protein